MLQWIATPFSFMRNCSKQYGDCFTVSLSPSLPSVVFVSDPESLQNIFTNDDSKLFDAPGELNAILEPIFGSRSVIGLSGDPHRRMRKLMMPPFHGERMRSYGHLINEVTDSVTRNWAPGRQVPARKAMQKISLQVILRAVFGLEYESRYRQVEDLLGKLLDAMGNPLSASLLFFPGLRRDFGPLSPWGRFVRMRQRIDALLYEEIAERRAHPDTSRNDILTLLLSARDEAGDGLTDAELRDELMTLLVAGHETTANALAWALYWIYKNPNVRQRLLEELESSDAFSESSDVSRLPYLSAVCNETLRIFPVAMLTFPRVARSRVEITGNVLEPGTIVVGCIYLAHHRESIYPEPDSFRPERFLENRFSPFEFLPFGGGIRRCIGMAFAQFEMKLVISKIVSTFDLALPRKCLARPRRRSVVSGPSPIRFTVRARHPAKLAKTGQICP